MPEARLTVDVPEGVFLFSGVKEGGSARWRFFKRQPDGSLDLNGTKFPKRIRNYLRRMNQQNEENHAQAKAKRST